MGRFDCTYFSMPPSHEPVALTEIKMLTLQCHLKMSMWQTEIDRFTIQFYLEISMWQKTVIDRFPLQCHLEMNLWHRTRLKDFLDTATLT
jgi:hypothetical protein